MRDAHSKCADDIKDRCNNGEPTLIPELIRCRIFDNIIRPTRRLIYHDRSLFYYVKNNPTEHYNSIVVKFVVGKRVPLCSIKHNMHTKHAQDCL